MPGVGTKYEMDTESGDRIMMVYMEKGGGVQLYVESGDGIESASARLTPFESRRIGNVLTGAVLEADEEEISVVFSALSDLSIKVHTYHLNERVDGKRLLDLQIRSKTGATVVAVSRRGESQVNPPADFVFLKGDSVLVIGESEQLKRFEEEFIKP
ncbi:potassium transporter TrkA [Methanoplanus sp. FWC-SCC4]|uniref:Potassium transporter TrkA n=1 Tax=Methanochimaera problematica TaxID=2609417 RepID=A0AA97FFH8_9EURY|nr:potassium transporter TrkA [Methanoplanus sp. FWC-SCC4]